jgi:His-Xaa-Ser system radical SAM maturase HxsC
MITLRARAAAVKQSTPLERRVHRIVGAGQLIPQRNQSAYLLFSGEAAPPGFPVYLGQHGSEAPAEDLNFVELPASLDYLSPGDIVSLANNGEQITVKWRHRSQQNSLLLTERCDHFCLMCSQPPKTHNDDHLMDEAFDVIRLLPRHTAGIGITGGEPTLYGDRLIELLRLCRTLVPDAGVHVLSNGRRFSNPDFAGSWASIDHPNLMVGIPIYGCEPTLHDYVVQAAGAFDDTIRGIVNLAALNQAVEIRVVIHQQTAPYLVEIAEFIAHNLPFVNQVALMGLEMIGLARANMSDVWIDPVEYADQLTQAVTLLDRRGIKVMVYNHQLCLIDPEIWPWTVKSISDWKNEYHPECLNCAVREQCGGFFFSAKYRMSDHIQAFETPGDGNLPEPALLQI